MSSCGDKQGVLFVRVRTSGDLASLIRGRRIARGLTQAELAGLAAVGRQWIVSVEAGTALPNLKMLLAVLEALDLELDVAPRASTLAPSERAQSAGVDLDSVLERHRNR
jgi:HTH-type transcriptional regulator/antitoxin HipB